MLERFSRLWSVFRAFLALKYVGVSILPGAFGYTGTKFRSMHTKFSSRQTNCGQFTVGTSTRVLVGILKGTKFSTGTTAHPPPQPKKPPVKPTIKSSPMAALIL